MELQSFDAAQFRAPDSVDDPKTLEFATAYASLGWCITPLKGKRPIRKQWPDNAATLESCIAELIATGNIGLVTGQVSGVVVLDIDPRNGGNASLRAMEDHLGALPTSLTCITGGGGRHLYFRYFEGATSCKPASGVDFQANRRCVVLPPSIHPETRTDYLWATTPTASGIVELPDSWKHALCSTQENTAKPGNNSDTLIDEGSRNNTLFNLAVELAKKGASESKIRRTLAEENVLRCNPPLELTELSALVRSSLKYRLGGQSLLTRFQHAVGLEQMPTGRKAVLWALSMFADQNGRNCYPTIEQVAQRAGMTRESAGRHLKTAEKEGWITRIAHSRANGPGFNYSYLLRIPISEEVFDEK